MADKSEFLGVRISPEQRRKLQKLARYIGEPGNMSASVRFLVDQVPPEKLGGEKVRIPGINLSRREAVADE